jgi:heme A synthase
MLRWLLLLSSPLANGLVWLWAVLHPPDAGASSLAAAALEIAGQVLCALVFLAAALTSPSYRTAPERIPDGGFPPLRALAVITPLAVAGQVMLGALYRHGILGLVPHVVWAFLIAILTMMVSAFAVSECPNPPGIRAVAGILITVTIAQVILGVTALVVRIQAEQPGPHADWMNWLRATHTAAGSAVFGLSVALGALLLRHVEPARISGGVRERA